MARSTSMLLQSYDLQRIKPTQKEDLLERKYLAGSMPLLIPNHSFETCGGTEVLTSTTIFKKCGVETSSGTYLER